VTPDPDGDFIGLQAGARAIRHASRFEYGLDPNAVPGKDSASPPTPDSRISSSMHGSLSWRVKDGANEADSGRGSRRYRIAF